MRLLSWNMAAGFGHSPDKHERGWQWLKDQDPDVALLQEVIPPSWVGQHWPTVIFAPTYEGKPWGSAIIAKEPVGAYSPSAATPWLGEMWGSTVVGCPSPEGTHWLASVHSNAYQVQPEKLALHPTDGIPQCKPGGYWQVELVAHDLHQLFGSRRFVMGGDLNSALLFDVVNNYQNNANLFTNLEEMGFIDLRARFSEAEQQTFFKKGGKPTRPPFR